MAASVDKLSDLFGLACTLVDKQAIQNEPGLHKLFMDKIQSISSLNQSQSLSSDDQEFYNWSKQLVGADEKVNGFVAKRLLGSKVAGSATSVDSSAETTRDYSIFMKEKEPSVTALMNIPLEKFVEAIAQESKEAILYVNLGLKMGAQGIMTVTFADGRVMSEHQLYVKALELDPKCSYAYSAIAASLNKRLVFTFPNGFQMNKQQLYLKAIELDQGSSRAFTGLGTTVPAGKMIGLPSQRAMYAEELHLWALQLNPKNAYAHCYLANSLSRTRTVSIPPSMKVVTKMDLYKMALELDPLNPWVHFSIAQELSKREAIVVNSKEMTHKFLYLMAIKMKPNYSSAYSALAKTLSPQETIALPNGVLANKQLLYFKSFETNQDQAEAYCVLASQGNFTFPNGYSMTAQQLALKAIEIDPNFARGYRELGNTLNENEAIILNNKEKMTQRDLFARALFLDPMSSTSYNWLGWSLDNAKDKITFTMPPNQKVTMSKIELFIKALEIDPTDVYPLYNLARNLELNEKVRFPNGLLMGTLDLCLKILELDPDGSDGDAFNLLGYALPANGSVTIPGGEQMDKRKAFTRAIEIRPSNKTAINNLRNILAIGETVRVGEVVISRYQ